MLEFVADPQEAATGADMTTVISASVNAELDRRVGIMAGSDILENVVGRLRWLISCFAIESEFLLWDRAGPFSRGHRDDREQRQQKV